MPPLLLFVQLPQLDTIVSGEHENLYLAAAYLDWAVRHSPLTRDVETLRLPPELDAADDATLVERIAALRPAFIACTTYLWNIERTLAVMARVKQRLPEVVVLLGGPEMARPHPLLGATSSADVAVVGEGERILPQVLAGLRAGRRATFACAAYRNARGYRWGSAEAPEISLAGELPPPDWPGLAPDARGMAYIETSRGCPMRCSYCRYHHLRRDISLLDPEAIVERVRRLREAGAREIRFVDPTFNAHPRFPETLRRLAGLNRDGRLAFFAELRADRITDDQADRLAEARFTEIEAGVQSLDPVVLKAVGRPADPARTGLGIRRMAERGIRVTLDLMTGLPFQTRAAVDRALDWALTFPASVNIQCMHTLMLPGTDLRRQAARLRMAYDPLPPYAVQSTPWMAREDFLAVENRLSADPRLRTDIPTQRLVGRTLPDLFPGAEAVPVPWPDGGAPEGPRLARQAWVFRGSFLFEHAPAICARIREAMRRSPHTLWQFVLEPDTEEPLDLLEAMIAVIRRQPPMIVDRYPPVALRGLLASRRILVKLKKGTAYDPGWIAAVRDCLEAAFF